MGHARNKGQLVDRKIGKTAGYRRAKDFDEELLRLLPTLRSFACALTRDVGAAEDLCQETIARAITFHGQFTPGTNLRAWLLTIMRNLFIAEKRTQSAFRSIADQVARRTPTVTGSNQIAHLELAELNDDIASLPRSQRRALDLVGRLGLTYQEAAKIEKCAVGTMKSRVSRARCALEQASE